MKAQHTAAEEELANLCSVKTHDFELIRRKVSSVDPNAFVNSTNCYGEWGVFIYITPGMGHSI